MRRRRRKTEPLGVSLFPFLAVLICTFGVLIVLLVIVVKQADTEAASARTERDETLAVERVELETQRDLFELRVEALLEARDQQRERLARARQARAYLQESLRKLEQRKEQLAAQFHQLEQPAVLNGQEIADLEAEQRRLELARQAAEAELSERRAELAAAPRTTYSIVPYEGGTGTHRRPIFIECTDQYIIFQPAGVRLSRADFTDPIGVGNPLDAALLAVREYWNRHELSGDSGDPYPLIVVRPEGANLYGLARHAIKSWDDEFGYELVDADLDIDFGQSDPQLAKAIEEAVEMARRRQQKMQQALAANGAALRPRGGRSSGLVASGTHGGFVEMEPDPQGGGRYRTGASGMLEPVAEPRSDMDPVASSTGQAGKMTGDVQNTESANAGPAAAAGGQAGNGNAASGQALTDSVAAERGQGWALPSRSPGAFGYVRPISLTCSADRLELSAGKRLSATIPFTGSTRAAVNPLVDQIWKVIESWGISGAGSYWIPELRIDVQPGGEQRFAELEQLLEGSGLQVQEVQR